MKHWILALGLLVLPTASFAANCPPIVAKEAITLFLDEGLTRLANSSNAISGLFTETFKLTQEVKGLEASDDFNLVTFTNASYDERPPANAAQARERLLEHSRELHQEMELAQKKLEERNQTLSAWIIYSEGHSELFVSNLREKYLPLALEDAENRAYLKQRLEAHVTDQHRKADAILKDLYANRADLNQRVIGFERQAREERQKDQASNSRQVISHYQSMARQYQGHADQEKAMSAVYTLHIKHWENEKKKLGLIEAVILEIP